MPGSVWLVYAEGDLSIFAGSETVTIMYHALRYVLNESPFSNLINCVMAFWLFFLLKQYCDSLELYR